MSTAKIMSDLTPVPHVARLVPSPFRGHGFVFVILRFVCDSASPCIQALLIVDRVLACRV